MKALQLLAISVILIGAGLLAYMVLVEGEPGALPLALVIGGGLVLWLGRRLGR